MQNTIQKSRQDTRWELDGDEPSTGFLPKHFREEAFAADAQHIRTVEQLKQFFTRNIDTLFERIQNICYQSTEQAEEVLQGLYPRLLRFLETQPQGIHDPWAAACRVARHLAIDEHRRTVRRRHEPLPDDNAFSDERLASTAGERNAFIDDAIKTLPPRLVNIIHGLFFDGRRGRELAAGLNLSEARLSELKTVALAQLKTYLQQTDPSAFSEFIP